MSINCIYIIDSESSSGCTERPIRSFELLADVESSWNKDKLVNYFVLKLTLLEPLLSRSVSHTSLVQLALPHRFNRLSQPPRRFALATSNGKARKANGTNAGSVCENTVYGFQSGTKLVATVFSARLANKITS